MDPRAEIDALLRFEGRGPGSDAERRAAGHLVGRLRELGREAEAEPTSVWPNYGLTHLIHALVAIAGSLLSVAVPAAGVALLLLAAVSTLGDLTGTLFLARRLTGRRASQNVVSTEAGDKPGKLVLVAHYDAGRAGSIFSPRAVERRAALGKRIRRPIALGALFFWTIVVVLLCAVARLLGVESTPLTVVQFVPTVLLVLSLPLLADIQLSPVVPGAVDNASGVATALRLAERFGGRLEHLDLWVLLPGAEEGMALGMRAWIKAHRSELPPERTIFLNLDKVGTGTVRYATKEGFVFTYPFHPRLIELCEEIAGEDEDERHFGAKPVVSRLTSDAHPARTRGYPATTISCLNALDYVPGYHQPTDTADRVEPEALERAFGFCSLLIERIDERIGPDLEREESTTALSEEE